jgi:transmembrane sensor
MEVDFLVIKRFLDGNIQEGDKEKILSWFSSFQAETDLRKGYYRYWNEELSNNLSIEGYDQEKVLGKIYHEIKLDESRSLVKKKVINSIINIITKVAAVLFIPLTVFLFVNKERLKPNMTNISYSEIYSPPGTRTVFYLPDGSTGCLNGGSYLKFPTVFKGESREVSLKGEAFFDVISNPGKPFIVYGENINVIAHGTSFNIKAFPEDITNKVTLVKGKVEVLRTKDGQIQKLGILEPNQMCVYDCKTSQSKIIQVDADKIIKWKEGKLVFINEPFHELVKELNRRYNINMVIKDPKLIEYSYLATFEDESMDEVINLLKLSAPIEVKDLGREKRSDGTYGKRIIELYYKAKK